MLCLMCGQENPESATVCHNCSAPIHKLNMVSSAPPQKVNKRYLQIKEACDKALSGEWSKDEYGEFIHNIKGVLEQKEQEIREVEIPEEAYEEFTEELTVGYQGIDLYNSGIAYMLHYLEDDNPANIVHGLNLILEGNEKINEAMRINRENRRKLEELYMDTASLM